MTVSKPTNLPTTVFSLLNSMFGCSIMVLPLLSLTLSWSLLLPIVIVTVLANWYSCQLVIEHLGPWTDVGDLVRCHFHSSFPKKLYDFAAALGLLTASTVYFKLIVLQIQGLILDYEHSSINTILNAVLLIAWCIAAKYCDVDTHLSGVGFISIAAYLLFLLWAAISRPDSSPTNEMTRESDPASFTAVMNNALAIQFIFVPIIKSYQQRASYTTIIALTFIITFVVYLYIDGVGAFGIATRRPEGVEETVENYFSQGEWQVKAIQSIYLFHLYSVFPQYMLAAKQLTFYLRKRVFALCSLPETHPRTLSLRQFFFLLVILSVAAGIQIANINVKQIITFHGAVFGFIYSYLVPCMFHIKCAYLDPIKNEGVREQEISPEELENKEKKGEGDVSAVQIQSKEIQINYKQSEGAVLKNPQKQAHKKCYYKRPALIWQILDWTMIFLMLGIGSFVLIYQLKQLL